MRDLMVGLICQLLVVSSYLVLKSWLTAIEALYAEYPD